MPGPISLSLPESTNHRWDPGFGFPGRRTKESRVSSDHIFIGETIGTAVLILLGGGVCAAVTLKSSKARNAGWVAITFGWGFAVLAGAYISGSLSGAHLNPAVT